MGRRDTFALQSIATVLSLLAPAVRAGTGAGAQAVNAVGAGTGLLDESDQQLPEVDAILNKAAETMKEFNDQAAAMQERVQQSDRASREALAIMRGNYEKKLSAQMEKSRKISVANEAIRADISSLELGNSALKEDAKSLQTGNHLMFHAIRALEPKMKTAKEFLAESLKQTDDTDAPELKVLQAKEPDPTLDHFLEVVRKGVNGRKHSNKEDEEVALIGTSVVRKKRKAVPKKEGPEDLVQVLSQRLDDLAMAAEEGDVKMKAQFLALFEVGDKQHTELLQEQQALNELRASLISLQAELHTAKAHLLQTQKELQQRLDGLRIFARKSKEFVGVTLRAADAAIKVKKSDDGRKPGGQPVQPARVPPLPRSQSNSSLANASAASEWTIVRA